jgi:bifunctional non-homologous end joining protein LigD
LSLPSFEPMLATRWDRPFDDDGWWFEVKWDGYRAVVGRDESGLRARSRRGLDLVDSFPELAAAPIPQGVVVDSEIVAFDESGRPSFSLLQRRTGFGGRPTESGGAAVNLVVFDLLYDGDTLVDMPYEERRQRLEHLELPQPIIVPAPTAATGLALYEVVEEQGLEGIVGKRLGSRYQPGKRSPDWRKVSVRRRLRAVVGGYLPGEGGRSSTFGSVLVGLYRGNDLIWIGAVGSGFDESSLRAFRDVLHQIERPDSPFANQVQLPQSPIWVEPSIVVSVEYKEWTADHHLRAPVYKGVEVVELESVTWETEGPG